MQEPNPELESSQIPSHWNFPERNTPGLKVTALDLNQRFLAFDLPTEYYSPQFSREGYGDYFFDAEGKPTDSRLSWGVGTEIKVGSEIRSWFVINPSSLNFSVSLKEPREDGDMGSFTFSPSKDEGERVGLNSIFLGHIFNASENEKNFVRSPGAVIMREEREGLKTKDWRLFLSSSSPYFSRKQENDVSNEASYFDLRGKLVFKLEWEVVEDSICVTQIHLPTQVRKILRAPLRVNTTLINEAILAKPPYARDKYGGLIVPWREIGRIVGATLGYENLPEPPKPEKRDD